MRFVEQIIDRSAVHSQAEIYELARAVKVRVAAISRQFLPANEQERREISLQGR